jgi:hypothetical protein
MPPSTWQIPSLHSLKFSPCHWNIWMQLTQNLTWQYHITNEYGSRRRNYLVLITRQFVCVHHYHKWEALCSLWDGQIKWHLLQSIHLIFQFLFPVVKRLKTLFNLHFPKFSQQMWGCMLNYVTMECDVNHNIQVALNQTRCCKPSPELDMSRYLQLSYSLPTLFQRLLSRNPR